MIDRKCPMCGVNLVRQRFQDSGGLPQDIYCPMEVTLPEDYRTFNHYTEQPGLEQVTLLAFPYRVVNKEGKAQIGIRKRFKTKNGKVTDKGNLYYKTILKCEFEIPPDTEEKLIKRIKTLITFS